MFNENSALVKIWVRYVEDGKITKEDVPNLFNLREIICQILDAQQDKNVQHQGD